MQNLHRRLLLIGALLLSHSANAENIIWGINNLTAMPLAHSKSITGMPYQERGLLFVMGQEIGLRLQHGSEFKRLHRRDIAGALKENKIDIACHFIPAWLDNDPQLRWSAPFMSEQQLLVSRLGSDVIRHSADLAGKTLGTVAHYRYSVLDSYESSVDFKRSPASSVTANVMQLFQKNPVDAIVIKSIKLAYLRNKLSRYQQLHLIKQPLILRELHLRCALGNNSHIDLIKFNQVIAQLRDENFFNRALEAISRVQKTSPAKTSLIND